ncbi:MAG: NAD(+) diphosphatase [Candidatus Latescibacteria bacterium]|nr:NAD(+) diphosphatase [Candidatus Latescibacterota bacterium]
MEEEEPVTNWEALDRQLEPAVVPPSGALGSCLYFAFSEDRLLVYADPKGYLLPRLESFGELDLLFRDPHYLGQLDDVHCFAVDLQTDNPPQGMALMGLRELYADFSEGIFQLAGRAFQVVNWDRTHHFCGRCGQNADYHESDRARRCPDCGLLSFPRVSPAVITLIHKGDEFLLARNARFPEGRYSIIAGFVEAGETLEEAVAREIYEEVGVEVSDITYRCSQPWPFPHSLMVGFTAAWAGGDIRIDEDEIVDAGWFSARHLPPSLPDGISISRRLIDSFLAEHP